jgi:hypothetical protein
MTVRSTESYAPAETIGTKAVTILAFGGKEQNCFSVFVLNAFHLFSVYAWHIFSLLAGWVWVQFVSYGFPSKNYQILTPRSSNGEMSHATPLRVT